MKKWFAQRVAIALTVLLALPLTAVQAEVKPPSAHQAAVQILVAAEMKVDPELLQKLLPLLQKSGRLDPVVAELLQARLADGSWRGAMASYEEGLTAFGMPVPARAAMGAEAKAQLAEELLSLLVVLRADHRLLAAASLCACLPELVEGPGFVTEVTSGFLSAVTPNNLELAVTTAQQAAAAAPQVKMFAVIEATTRKIAEQEKQRAVLLRQALTTVQVVTPHHKALMREFTPENLYEKRRLSAMPVSEKNAKLAELKVIEDRLKQADAQRLQANMIPTISEETAAAVAQLVAAPAPTEGETKP